METLHPTLFSEEPTAQDHVAYGSLRNNEARSDLREWCEATYERHKHQLDADFVPCFRREIPKRFSELFFAAAFEQAGWEPTNRVTGFDLAYRLGDYRLLVEVTTPAPPSTDSWTEEQRNGHTLYSGDSKTVEACLLRLTAGLSKKSERIRLAVEADPSLRLDYKVVALSGFQISQETPFPLSESGRVPDFIHALLPIGDMYARFPVGPGSEDREVEWGYQTSALIEKPTGGPVARTAFLDGLVPNVDAVAFSSMNLFGLQKPHWQVGVLHNPTSNWAGDPCDLGMGNEYFVTLEEETFEVRRRKLAELPDD